MFLYKTLQLQICTLSQMGKAHINKERDFSFHRVICLSKAGCNCVVWDCLFTIHKSKVYGFCNSLGSTIFQENQEEYQQFFYTEKTDWLILSDSEST